MKSEINFTLKKEKEKKRKEEHGDVTLHIAARRPYIIHAGSIMFYNMPEIWACVRLIKTTLPGQEVPPAPAVNTASFNNDCPLF